MSMSALNVIQFIELFIGYIGFTVVLPALVFYRKVKGFPAPERFLIYFTVGNFYVINMVQVLELLHISYRATLFIFTFVPAVLLIVRSYNIPVIAYIKKVAGEVGNYVQREIGFKTFIRHRWQEIKVFLRVVFRNIGRLVKENYAVLPFVVIFTALVWGVCGSGILNNWGYGYIFITIEYFIMVML